MLLRHAIALVGLLGTLSAAAAQDFRIEDVGSARGFDVARLKPGVVAFSDHEGSADSDEASLIRFEDWARTRPNQKKFLSLFPGYTEVAIEKPEKSAAKSDAQPDPKSDAKPDPKTE